MLRHTCPNIYNFYGNRLNAKKNKNSMEDYVQTANYIFSLEYAAGYVPKKGKVGQGKKTQRHCRDGVMIYAYAKFLHISIFSLSNKAQHSDQM